MSSDEMKKEMDLEAMKEMMYQKALEQGVDFNALTEGLETKTYLIPPTVKVPLHEHATQDEIFYCVKGNGIGIVDDKEFKFSPSDSFIAPAGSVHSIKSDETLFVMAFLIPVNRIICHCKQVSYVDIRIAMVKGARTVEEIKTMTGAGTGCGNCIKDIEKILSMACGCKMVTVEDVVKAVENGADTVEKIGEVTGAGTDCGNCKMLLQNIIDLRK
jgi:bacterioferritin-associated ferredoxin/mannose-6-phosphate isomerase-like protein (cupin superfamily)